MQELKRLRKLHNLTQKELAKQLDISYSMYVKVENQFQNPSYTVLKKLKAFYKEELDLNLLV